MNSQSLDQVFQEVIVALSPIIIGSILGAIVNFLVIIYVIWCIHKIQRNTKEINDSLKELIFEYKKGKEPPKYISSYAKKDMDDDSKWMPK